MTPIPLEDIPVERRSEAAGLIRSASFLLVSAVDQLLEVDAEPGTHTPLASLLAELALKAAAHAKAIDPCSAENNPPSRPRVDEVKQARAAKALLDEIAKNARRDLDDEQTHRPGRAGTEPVTDTPAETSK